MSPDISSMPNTAEDDFADQMLRPRRPPGWSWTAITGFVLSLLGILGVTAILGFIFGLFGLLATRNNQLRGRKLAIAALPISIVMAALSVALLFVIQAALGIQGAMVSLRVSLGQPGEDSKAAMVALRDVCTEDFNASVSDEQLEAWLTSIRSKYGTLASIQVSPNQSAAASSNARVLICEGKFVNGLAAIQLFPKFEKPWRCRIDNIEINGSSPR